MERIFLFNYDALDNYLNEQQKNPNRTDWEITMLRDNCRNNLLHVLINPQKYIIIINEFTWDVTINGEIGLEDKFDMLPTWYKMNNKDRLYRQVKLAMERTKNHWMYDEFFKEVKEIE